VTGVQTCALPIYNYMKEVSNIVKKLGLEMSEIIKIS